MNNAASQRQQKGRKVLLGVYEMQKLPSAITQLEMPSAKYFKFIFKKINSLG